MIHQKTIDYCENIIEALGGIDQLEYEFNKYLEEDKSSAFQSIPLLVCGQM